MSVNQFEDSLKEFEHDEFEQGLSAAMRRVDAPEGFAERTLAQAIAARIESSTPKRAKVLTMARHTRQWVGGAIAAALVVGAFTGEETHLRHQREQVALAQQQFEIAMRITDQTLEHVRQQLQQAGVGMGN
jgi:hypothetical protein